MGNVVKGGRASVLQSGKDGGGREVMLQSNLRQIKGAVSDLKNEIHLASFLVLSSPQTQAAPHTQRQENR